MPWTVWITGLPGSGKSTIALHVKKKSPDAVILRIDELRKIVTPTPAYSGEEREYVYKALVYTAKTVYDLGHNVIIDATGNRKLWRKLARIIIPDFYEVYLKCPLNLCVEREKTRVESHSALEDAADKILKMIGFNPWGQIFHIDNLSSILLNKRLNSRSFRSFSLSRFLP